jgi:hypothetical protein
LTRWCRSRQANDNAASARFPPAASSGLGDADDESAHITTLKEVVAMAEALGEQRRQEAEAANKRVDNLIGELVARTMIMAEQTAVADKVRAELDAYRARPWWKRLAG